MYYLEIACLFYSGCMAGCVVYVLVVKKCPFSRVLNVKAVTRKDHRLPSELILYVIFHVEDLLRIYTLMTWHRLERKAMDIYEKLRPVARVEQYWTVHEAVVADVNQLHAVARSLGERYDVSIP